MLSSRLNRNHYQDVMCNKSMIQKVAIYILHCSHSFLPFFKDGVMWTSEDDGHVEKLADDPVPDDPQGYPIVGSISSYFRDIGFLISWSVQSIKNGVVAIFQRIGGVFRGRRAHDHDD